MTAPPGKMRTRGHVLADLSINHVERQALLSGCSVQRMYSDYGYDLIMSTFKATGELETGIVFFQVKATDHLPLLADGTTIPWVLSRRDPRSWLDETCPVILVVYDGLRDRAFWLHMQAYFAGRPAPDVFLAGDTVTVHIPVASRLNRRAIRRIVERKNTIQAHALIRDSSDA